MFVDTSVGERVRVARERCGLSARALAAKADLSAGYVALIERGQRPSPSGEVFRKLAAALGVSIDWLITGRATADETGPQPAIAVGPGDTDAA